MVLACTRLTTRRVYTVFLLVIYIIPIICRRRRPSAVVIVERGSLCATMYVYYSIYICIINARTVVADDRHDRASFDGYTQHILYYYIIYIMAIGHLYI